MVYGGLHMQDVMNPDALWIFLGTRRDHLVRFVARMENFYLLTLPPFNAIDDSDDKVRPLTRV